MNPDERRTLARAAIMERRDLDGREKMLLLSTLHHREKTGEAPEIKDLAEYCGLTQNGVRGVLKRLERFELAPDEDEERRAET